MFDDDPKIETQLWKTVGSKLDNELTSNAYGGPFESWSQLIELYAFFFKVYSKILIQFNDLKKKLILQVCLFLLEVALFATKYLT